MAGSPRLLATINKFLDDYPTKQSQLFTSWTLWWQFMKILTNTSPTFGFIELHWNIWKAWDFHWAKHTWVYQQTSRLKFWILLHLHGANIYISVWYKNNAIKKDYVCKCELCQVCILWLCVHVSMHYIVCVLLVDLDKIDENNFKYLNFLKCVFYFYFFFRQPLMTQSHNEMHH